ncbi:uncharacterized protein [Chelonus insularis]|uniref:uncharacterized protein n=1 Tax=Chelonus insularis TaxID=460826 RepID=UPI00158DF7B6|nr:uncharacterized protein LOC118072792 [Chelonus insularis]
MKTFVFSVTFLLFSVLLLTECQPVSSDKSFQERAQEALDAMTQKTKEIVESVQESANRALESARAKWQEFMNSTSVPSIEGDDSGSQSLMDFGKNIISNIMGTPTTIQPPVEPPVEN